MTRAFTPMAGIRRLTGTDLGSGARPARRAPRRCRRAAAGRRRSGERAAEAGGTGGGAQRCSSALTPMTSSPAPMTQIAAMISRELPVSLGFAGRRLESTRASPAPNGHRRGRLTGASRTAAGCGRRRLPTTQAARRRAARVPAVVNGPPGQRKTSLPSPVIGGPEGCGPGAGLTVSDAVPDVPLGLQSIDGE